MEIQKKCQPLLPSDESEMNTVDILSSKLISIKQDEDTNIISNDNNADEIFVFTSSIKDEKLPFNEDLSSDLFYDFQAENFHAEQVDYSLTLFSMILKKNSVF